MVAAWLYVNTNFIELKQRGRTPSGPKFILYNHKDKTSTGERHKTHRSDSNNMIFLASLHHHRLHILTSAFIILVFSPSQLLCLTTRMFGVWSTHRPVAACVSLFAPWEVFQGRLPESRLEDISCHVSWMMPLCFLCWPCTVNLSRQNECCPARICTVLHHSGLCVSLKTVIYYI